MRNKIIFVCAAAVLLIAAFLLGGTEETVRPETETTSIATTTEPSTEFTSSAITTQALLMKESTESSSVEPATLTQPYTEAAQETQTYVEPVTETTTAALVYLSVDYKTLIGKYDKADQNMGVVYTGTHTYYSGETAFDLLRDAMQAAGIPMEFSKTPVYDSVYIEGIDNVYEFDFGEMSGWTYKVNGVFPGYSSSEYILSPGDRVEFVYTCDMGRDVGNEYSVSEGNS